MKIKPIIRPSQKDISRLIQVGDDIQIWYRAAKYDTTWLTNRRNKVNEVITIIQNANISDYVFEVLGQITAELNAGVNYNQAISFKQNVINRLISERDDIDWVLVLGSSSSSSSSRSSSSSSSFSLSYSSSSSSSSSYSYSYSYSISSSS